MPRYSELENKIIRIIQNDGQFVYAGEGYSVLKVGKPRPQGSGECKTDVYILGDSNGFQREFKISVKSRRTNEFQENKVNAERAESFFGENYEDIIERTTRSISSKFREQPLLFASGKHPTKPNSVTMGWKLEIADKPRRLSAPLHLSDQEARDFIYKGINLPDNKRNSVLDGEVIYDSGVAEYMLYAEVDEICTTSDIFDNIQLIDDVEFEPLYLIFTANNYRTVENSTDGARPLAVRVHYNVIRGRLSHSLAFNNPLALTGKDLVPEVRQAFSQLGVLHPSELHLDQIEVPSILLP
ncbi:hypothetical protein HPT25_01630 [Bacillus sp. BRMEA1]|uniref:hypothetical protein n=1 Tax=Neobacillus endophyticus TaxID=2738405 RepID=UPI001565CC5F|nr:hypothetical protein [Neobacillus endophyticus]NRD76208.1 hypothetical protein [Neobacillus endophyticus]